MSIPTNIWTGIYESLNSAPATGEGYLGDKWLKLAKSRIQEWLKNTKKTNDASLLVQYGTNLLPLVVLMLNEHHRNSKIKILDFGGGLGMDYLRIKATLENMRKIEFCVVDNNKKICEAGKKLFNKDPQIKFSNFFSGTNIKFDIVHLGSSIQYTEDWKGLLKKLSGFDPKYILISNTPIGKIPTYVTLQSFYGDKIPMRFFNIDELSKEMKHLGFSLLFKSAHSCYAQDNFPKKFRTGCWSNLIFAKNGQINRKKQ